MNIYGFDITDRKRTEEALRESEELFRLAASFPSIVLAEVDRELRYTWIHNPHPDFDASRVIGKRDDELDPSEDARRLVEMKREAMESGQTRRIEWAIDRSDGRHYYDVHIRPRCDETGNITGLTTAAIDITDRKRAEEELRRRESEFRALAENSPDMITRLDSNLRHVYANHAAERATGIPREQIMGKTHRELGLPDAVTVSSVRAFLDVLATGEEKEAEFDIPGPSGNRIYQARFTPEYGENGKITSVLAVSRDITDRKRAEEKLQESRAHLEATLDALPDIMFEIDREGRIYEYHAYHAEQLYVPPQEFLGRRMAEALPTDAAAIITKAIARAAETGRDAGAVYSLEISGKTEWFELSIVTMGDSKMPKGRFIILARNITERKQAEERIEQLRREQEAFMRHEVKNLFAPMQLFAEMLLHDTKNLTAEQVRFLRRIEETAEKAVGFIDSLKRIQDIENGKYALKRGRHPLDMVIRNAIQ
ncbi:MAG: PAS domain-containing protein, partial [Candidatus Latescibacterota bacterium]